MGRDPFHQPRVLRAPSNLALNPSREGETAMGNWCQGLTTPRVKNSLLTPNLNLPSFSSKPSPLVPRGGGGRGCRPAALPSPPPPPHPPATSPLQRRAPLPTRSAAPRAAPPPQRGSGRCRYAGRDTPLPPPPHPQSPSEEKHDGGRCYLLRSGPPSAAANQNAQSGEWRGR